MENKKQYYYKLISWDNRLKVIKLPLGVSPTDLTSDEKQSIYYGDYPLRLKWLHDSDLANKYK